MAVKIVEWEKPYTWWTGIEITANKVINLILREANNLIKVNDNNEVYADLQMAANTVFALNNIEVWVTVGRVSTQDWWAYTGTVLAYKTTSGTTNMILYADNWNLYFYNWANWIQIYTKPQIDAFVQELREEMELLRQEIIALIPTKTSDLQNDSGFITVAVTWLTNYYDKTTIDQFLNLKADKTALASWLDLKVDKATTYEMTNLNLNEAWVMSETFTNQALTQTLQIIKNALSTLYDWKASAVATQQALNLKADITYVDELVWNTLGISTVVVDSLPTVWQWNYIYLVPISWQPNNYTKYVWNATARDYINLWTTDLDLSNVVTLDTAQSITWIKTFTVDPVLPANTAQATNNNTKSARESQVYQVSQNLSVFQTTASNTYATKTELNNAITGVEWWVGAGNITMQINSSTSWITNPTFWVNQWSDQTVNITINKATVWLSNVDNTSDANKPVSTAQATAIAWAVSALADTVDAELANKQDTLVSGSNIKTLNGTSLLGSWNLELEVDTWVKKFTLASTSDTTNAWQAVSYTASWKVAVIIYNDLEYHYVWNVDVSDPNEIYLDWNPYAYYYSTMPNNWRLEQLVITATVGVSSTTVSSIATDTSYVIQRATSTSASKIRTWTEAEYSALSSYDNDTLYFIY